MAKRTEPGHGTAQDATTREVEALVVDYRRGGMSYRQIGPAVEAAMRRRFKAAHDADVHVAAAEGREPISARQDWTITHEACRLAFKRVMRRANEQLNEDAGELRRLELARLDELQLALWPKALGQGRNGNEPIPVQHQTQAALACLKIMERRAALTGIEDLGAIGEEGAEVVFSVWKPEDIAKKRRELGIDPPATSPPPTTTTAPSQPDDVDVSIALQRIVGPS